MTTENETIAQPVEAQQEQEQSKESSQDINWKNFREAREKERKEKEDAVRIAKQKEEEALALKNAMEALLSQKNANSQEQSYDESDDQRIKKAVQEALAESDQRRELERQQREQQEYPQRLNQAYSDFNEVCTAENLDYLEYHYPEVATGLKYIPEGFEKWSSIYKAVKKFIPNADSKKEQKMAERNMNKPQSISAGANTQSTDMSPMKLDDQRRQDNWKRMQKTLRGIK